MENSKQNDAASGNSRKKALIPGQQPDSKKGQEDNVPFELSKIGSVEGPLQFRELLRDEHIDMSAALIVGPVTITWAGSNPEGKISSNSQGNMAPQQQPLSSNMVSTGVTQQANKKPAGALIVNSQSQVVALYEEKLFLLGNQTGADSRPTGVLDLEFLTYKETQPSKDNPIASFTLTKREQSVTFTNASEEAQLHSSGGSDDGVGADINRMHDPADNFAPLMKALLPLVI